MAGIVNMRKSALWLTVITALAFGLVEFETARAASRIKTVVVIGAGRMYKDDVANARERAISMGLVSAVDRVVAAHMSREDRIRHFDVLNMVIYGDIRAYIQGYKVLTEARADKMYHVLMEASVANAALAKKLSTAGLLKSKKSAPRVLLLITERDFGESPPRYWWNENPALTAATSAKTMAKKLEENGFTIIDASGSKARASAAVFRHKPTLTDREAFVIGSRLKAKIVIVGEAVVEKAPNTMSDGSRTFKGVVKARAIRPDIGSEIAVLDQEFSAVHTEDAAGVAEALSGVGALAGENLAPIITEKWQKEAEKPVGVEIFVEGVANLKNYITFRKSLKEMAGVTGVQRKEMSLNEAKLFVNYGKDAKTLAKNLMLITFDSFGINIYEITENTLKIKLISNNTDKPEQQGSTE